MDGVKVTLGNRGMTVEAANQFVTKKVSQGHFDWSCVLSDRPAVLWWLSPGEGWDAVT